LAAHLDAIQFEPSLVTTEWFLCVFAKSFPSETTLRVWDVLFNEGAKVLFRVALALFKMNEAELYQAAHLGEAVEVLVRSTAQQYDPEVLLQVAFDRLGSMSMATIAKQRRRQKVTVIAALELRQQRVASYTSTRAATAAAVAAAAETAAAAANGGGDSAAAAAAAAAAETNGVNGTDGGGSREVSGSGGGEEAGDSKGTSTGTSKGMSKGNSSSSSTSGNNSLTRTSNSHFHRLPPNGTALTPSRSYEESTSVVVLGPNTAVLCSSSFNTSPNGSPGTSPVQEEEEEEQQQMQISSASAVDLCSQSPPCPRTALVHSQTQAGVAGPKYQSFRSMSHSVHQQQQQQIRSLGKLRAVAVTASMHVSAAMAAVAEKASVRRHLKKYQQRQRPAERELARTASL
ncbi:unnamed protein product, partial [Closterium sp. NIES-54]